MDFASLLLVYNSHGLDNQFGQRSFGAIPGGLPIRHLCVAHFNSLASLPQQRQKVLLSAFYQATLAWGCSFPVRLECWRRCLVRSLVVRAVRTPMPRHRFGRPHSLQLSRSARLPSNDLLPVDYLKSRKCVSGHAVGRYSSSTCVLFGRLLIISGHCARGRFGCHRLAGFQLLWESRRICQVSKEVGDRYFVVATIVAGDITTM